MFVENAYLYKLQYLLVTNTIKDRGCQYPLNVSISCNLFRLMLQDMVFWVVRL